jgi:hypothetical protein
MSWLKNDASGVTRARLNSCVGPSATSAVPVSLSLSLLCVISRHVSQLPYPPARIC